MSHQVELIPSGHSFAVADGVSVLDAALAAGVALPYGCQTGACRSCRARVADGRFGYPGGLPKALDPLDTERGFALLCMAHAESDLRLEIEELDAFGVMTVSTLPCRVVERARLAPDVMRVRLALREGDRLPHLAGQYVDVLMRDGRRRAFSLASAPGGTYLELHIRHVPDGQFSGYVFEHLAERAILRIRGPLGSFYLRRDDTGPVVLVAGGTGFAPIKSMLEEAFARGLEHPMKLYWGARDRPGLYLHELARTWADDHALFGYVPVLSAPAPADAWTGRTGFVHEAVLEDHATLAGHSVYMSGPPPMVAAGREHFPARGLDPTKLHSDSFDHAYETGHDAF